MKTLTKNTSTLRLSVKYGVFDDADWTIKSTFRMASYETLELIYSELNINIDNKRDFKADVDTIERFKRNNPGAAISLYFNKESVKDKYRISCGNGTLSILKRK